jgi:hypothetical protein
MAFPVDEPGARANTSGDLRVFLGEVPPDLPVTVHVDLGGCECYGVVHRAHIAVERDRSRTLRLSASEYVPPRAGRIGDMTLRAHPIPQTNDARKAR